MLFHDLVEPLASGFTYAFFIRAINRLIVIFHQIRKLCNQSLTAFVVAYDQQVGEHLRVVLLNEHIGGDAFIVVSIDVVGEVAILKRAGLFLGESSNAALQLLVLFCLLADLIVFGMHLLLDGDNNLIESALERVLLVIPLEGLDVLQVWNTIRIVVRVLVDEVATGLLSSAFDLTGVHLDSFDLLANDLKLGINACSGLIQLHQDLQRANLELFPVNIVEMERRAATGVLE